MDLELDGKVALVTGSSKGIGEGIAYGLAREGAVVIVHGRNKVKTEAAAHNVIAEGGHTSALVT
nr:SDR family NAD(P)-dependent oxidoreductase [Pseudorhizobium pelagicum]